MLIIRLQRVGRKNDPSFRIIVTDHHRAAKAGKALEVLGSYDARSTAGQPRPVQLKAERVKHWLGHGAQVSGTVHNLLVDQKIISGKKINVLPRKSVPAKAEAVPVEAAPEASAASAETPATV